MTNLRNLIKIKRSYEDQLLVKKNVTGCSVGLKQVNQEYTNEQCIVVYVSPKTEEVDQDDLIPPRLEGIKTDVQEMIPFIDGLGITSIQPYDYNSLYQEEECLEAQKRAAVEMKLFNTVDLAMTTFVTVDDLYEASKKSGFFMSNLEAQLKRRPRTAPIPGISIGRYLVPIELVFLGASVFMRALTALKKSKSMRNKRLNLVSACEIKGLGKTNGFAKPELGMVVLKSGRTTDVTNGKIVGVDASLYVDYPMNVPGNRSPDFGEPIFSPSPMDGGRFPSDVIGYLSGYVPIRFPIEERPNLCNISNISVKRALFVEQIVTTVRVLRGDSGAPLVTADMKYVGMLFAGSSNLSFFHTNENLEIGIKKDMVWIDS